MLAKLEPFAEFQPTKALSHKIEQFLRQHKVTDYACNSFQDTLLLKIGIAEDVKPLTMEFVKPDFVRVGMMVESTKLEKIKKYFEFLQQYDSTTTLEHIENNIYSIRMDCTTCLEKVTPVFEKAFLERIQADPNCLKLYQEESEREYTQFLEKKLEDMKDKTSPLISVHDKKDAFFSTANSKTTAPLAPSNNPENSTTCFQPH